MKFTGPYKVGRTNGTDHCAFMYGRAEGEEKPTHIICYATKLNVRPIGEQLRDMRRIADALNAAEGIPKRPAKKGGKS
jgi:hypothetical protein